MYSSVLFRQTCPGWSDRLIFLSWPFLAELSLMPWIVWPARLTCLCWSGPSVLSRLACPGWPVQADLSRLTSPGWQVQADESRLTCPGWPVRADLSRLNFHDSPFHCWTVLADSSSLNCLGGPAQGDLSKLSVPNILSQLSYPSRPVQAVLSRLSCHVALSWFTLSQLTCPSYVFCPLCPVRAVHVLYSTIPTIRSSSSVLAVFS